MNGKKIEIGDFAVYKYPTNLALSPDGAYAAFAVVEPNIEDNCYDSCIWLCNTETKGIRQLTSGKRERSFAWLDGETILFIGNREGEKEAEETFGERRGSGAVRGSSEECIEDCLSERRRLCHCPRIIL